MRGVQAIIIVVLSASMGEPLAADSARIDNPANNHQYQRIDRELPWTEAQAFCDSLGGYLATITGAAEGDFIREQLIDLGFDRHYWLGGSDAAGEAGWRWVTGEPWVYTNWCEGEPNNFLGDEDYLETEDSPYCWNDHADRTNPQFPKYFICEWNGATGCELDATTLCLDERRFRVRASWTGFDGESAPASAVQLQGDFGYFWFFDPGNAELFVKIVDACVPPWNSFWVFVSGLTNVGVALEVEDTASGKRYELVNAVGQPFEPVLETATPFTDCDL